MSLLSDHDWKFKYTPEDGNLLTKFYIPALSCVVRYDRSTGYFAAQALAAAAQGVEELIHNSGKMRLLVGCTLDEPEVEAVLKGESLRDTLEAHVLQVPLKSTVNPVINALELLAWMVAQGHLEVRVAVPCDAQKRPVASQAIFHEKAGIIEDKTGDRLAFNGSINETIYGWTQNWDSFHVFTSWGTDAHHVDAEEAGFQRLWANRATAALVLDMPTAMRENLLHFLPKDDRLPQLLEQSTAIVHHFDEMPGTSATEIGSEQLQSADDRRTAVWNFIAEAPSMPNGGERVGEATCSVTPWPHQVHAFHRMYDHWPPKILIADEVGLGKTIQAGLLLRQAWLSGRAKRVLVLAPKAVLKQWQIELREKFNLNWPIYDGQKLCWYPSPALRHTAEKVVARNAWHHEPFVLASSHLMRRKDRAEELLQATNWDVIVLDEAHHARRKSGGTAKHDDRPNQLLRLMQKLIEKTTGLILLTATPMQVSPIEVWDLLNLLGLPPEWNVEAFLKFFENVAHPNPSDGQMLSMASMFKAGEASYGSVALEEARRFAPRGSKIVAKKILKALRENASIPLRRLETDERKAAVAIMKAYSPLKRLISRHTRELLRRYHKSGKLQTRIATRLVEDRLIEMTPAERHVYDAVEDYITTTYNNALPDKRTAIGFVMTVYRRRLASSFFSLAQTLEKRLVNVKNPAQGSLLEEDILEDDLAGEIMDAEDAAELESLAQEETDDIGELLRETRRLPVDTKANVLLETIEELRRDGFGQVMIFTQYTDSLDFLRGQVTQRFGASSVLCFSGRGGEVQGSDGAWRVISREETKTRFREHRAEVMLCTDAAAEGLNFQFCGALINYDMPWNPMRVEQRIGRIDRLGQEFEHIRIVNLHYANTVETDVYCALKERIALFTNFVGKLQPILARLPKILTAATLKSKNMRANEGDAILSELNADIQGIEESGFDLDGTTDDDVMDPVRPLPLYDLNYLHDILNAQELLPHGVAANRISEKDFAYSAPGMRMTIRVTTDADYFDAHPESVELWSPGCPIFPGNSATTR